VQYKSKTKHSRSFCNILHTFHCTRGSTSLTLIHSLAVNHICLQHQLYVEEF